jgi:hypothetical protein
MSRSLERAITAVTERVVALESAKQRRLVYVNSVSAECKDREPNHARLKTGGVEWSRDPDEHIEMFKRRIARDLEDESGWITILLSYRWL